MIQWSLFLVVSIRIRSAVRQYLMSRIVDDLVKIRMHREKSWRGEHTEMLSKFAQLFVSAMQAFT